MRISFVALGLFAGSVLAERQHLLYESQRLIKVSEGAKPRWVSIDDILVLRRTGVKFVDITDVQELYEPKSDFSGASYISKLPDSLAHGSEVKKATADLTTQLYGDVLTPFTAFHNRYYDSENGRKSSEWLQGQVSALVEASKANVTVRAFPHRFPQSSIIARVEGTGANADETVVLSAHQDSVNQWIPWFGRANGADDDGSGTVTILEAFRVLLKRGFAPSRSVEFHWYAGEEGGLLGSQDIALSYQKAKRKVVANLHFDMTGFWRGSEVIGLVSDRTDAETRKLTKLLAETYTKFKTQEFACGYGCSDHASWNKAGYRSAMAFESAELEANTNVHSPRDTVETLDFDHMLEFSKLAVAFAYEVGYAK
ncbi:Zn-dependent exopeptidase [Linderina pennispora]|uniref:Peptide hydrolase n=1 Tax=Linderina pennispora TaxID=61395 RepID=A0A1Y1VYS4_9FUNG|nr:Zn-dependent exopeptidase [Linderina pennispora]ORX66417.1 Zn-dependent exopeptidase [Linderina pennispora]